MDHVPRVALLLQNAVDAPPQAEVSWIGPLVLRHHPRAGRTGTVEALALEVLPSPPALDVARAHVVEHEVPEDVLHRIAPADVGAALADDHSQLNLPVDLLADRRVDRDVVIRTGDAGDCF